MALVRRRLPVRLAQLRRPPEQPKPLGLVRLPLVRQELQEPLERLELGLPASRLLGQPGLGRLPLVRQEQPELESQASRLQEPQRQVRQVRQLAGLGMHRAAS